MPDASRTIVGTGAGFDLLPVDEALDFADDLGTGRIIVGGAVIVVGTAQIIASAAGTIRRRGPNHRRHGRNHRPHGRIRCLLARR